MSLPSIVTGSSLEVHIFVHEGQHYAFDARSFAVFTLSPVAARVLALMSYQTVEEIVVQLSREAPRATILQYYLDFMRLMASGALSTGPVPPPSQPPFSHIVIMLAGGCNMACSYCFEKDVPIYQKPNLLSDEVAGDILDWFFSHHEGNFAHIEFYGGEALLNWTKLEHITFRAEAWAKENKIQLSKYLITNGTLLTPSRISFLKEHAITVQVSVDGDETDHNALRVLKSGLPTFDAIKKNIAELIAQNADFNIRAVMTHRNTNPKSLLESLKRLGTERVSFEVVATCDQGSRFGKADWVQYSRAYRDYAFENIATNEVPEVNRLANKIRSGGKVHYGCGAGKNEVTVAPDGSIYECQRIYREPYGHIRENKNLKELGSTFLSAVDDRPICKDCWARYLCGGGCLHQSHVEQGDTNPVPGFCQVKRDLSEAAIIKVARNPKDDPERSTSNRSWH